jgi:hypothetical protein
VDQVNACQADDEDGDQSNDDEALACAALATFISGAWQAAQPTAVEVRLALSAERACVTLATTLIAVGDASFAGLLSCASPHRDIHDQGLVWRLVHEEPGVNFDVVTCPTIHAVDWTAKARRLGGVRLNEAILTRSAGLAT